MATGLIERVLHTDRDRYKVVLRVERNGRRYVTYERYPNIKYRHLTSFHAACLILLGVELEHCYVP